MKEIICILRGYLFCLEDSTDRIKYCILRLSVSCDDPKDLSLSDDLIQD